MSCYFYSYPFTFYADAEYQVSAIGEQMARKLTLEDLKPKKEIEEEQLEDLYDLIIPPGTPSYIIYDMVEEFDLEPVERKISVNIIECDQRELLVLRGKLEVVQAAEKFLYDELAAWVNDAD